MIFLGLILVLLAVGAGVLVFSEESTRYILFGYTFELNQVEMFLFGAVAAAVLVLGLWMMSSGARRTAKQRRNLRAARAEASSRVAQLEDEKRELQRKLEREHAAKQVPAQREHTTGRHTVPEGDRLVSRGAEDTRP
ncbi:NADH dehydrogenase subunit 6 [Actinomadura sp. ATCC 31491]|uniref:NADH dehydrogenase subunit 6 n=1 Tax=Actinomadura luzonensis TaxID=2805427 RepID=A0ABT0FQ88_9ACTN|nr:NADH dehydrogenase subunit 6 [Actinomadura luzonensis]MCK2214523.1 NADH dehydrogenase subunit 6 [Actinomadura luzonensis]